MQCRLENVVLLQSPVGTVDIRQVMEHRGIPANEKNDKPSKQWQTHTHK